MCNVLPPPFLGPLPPHLTPHTPPCAMLRGWQPGFWRGMFVKCLLCARLASCNRRLRPGFAQSSSPLLCYPPPSFSRMAVFLTNFWIHCLLPVEASNHHQDNQIPDAFITRRLVKFDVGRGLALTRPLPPRPGLGPQGRAVKARPPSLCRLTEAERTHLLNTCSIYLFITLVSQMEIIKEKGPRSKECRFTTGSSGSGGCW